MAETQRESITSLLKIISCLHYLARRGLPFRVHGDEKEANLKQLIRFRAEDDPAFAKWLKKKEYELHLTRDSERNIEIHELINPS